jgi:acetolactate synthase-1/2/3 large subunit
MLHDALAAALGPDPGPAVLLVPKDFQRAPLHLADLAHAPMPSLRSIDSPSPQAIESAARILDGARAEGRSVVILAGEGVARHDARGQLAELAERLAARVAVAPDARDTFDNHHPRFAGVTGVMGHPTAQACVESADLCVLVGTRLPHMARVGLERGLRGKMILSIHSEPSFIEGVHLEVGGQLRLALGALLQRLGPATARRSTTAVGEAYLPSAFLPASGPSQALGFREALEAVAGELPADANVFIDAGNTGASAVHHLKSPSRGRYVVALGMGGMGYTFGAAIGAAFANRRRTFVLAGDGAFFMHGLELHTAVEHQLPITFLLFNNHSHAMCYARDQLYFREGNTCNLFQRTRIGAGMAAMFPSLTVLPASSALELGRSVRTSCASEGPSLMEIEVDPNEVAPFTSFLEALSLFDLARSA